MKKFLIQPILLLILTGCMQLNLKYQPRAELINKYDNHVKDKNVAIYYTVQKTEKGKIVNMAVQNVGNIYMKNLTINYDECCQGYHQGPGKYNYKNLGNLKNKSYKTMSLDLKGSTDSNIKLVYNFTPVIEDKFLKSTDEYTPASQVNSIRDTIRIYINN